MNAKAAALLVILSCQFAVTTQSAWWLSDTELFFEDPLDASYIYNTLLKSRTEVLATEASIYSLISYSHDLHFAAEFLERAGTNQGAHRSLLIHTMNKNTTECSKSPASYGEILSFKWSHGSAFSFSNETGSYYVASLGQGPIRIGYSDEETISDDGEDDEPNVILDEPVKIRENNMHFSPRDKYIAYFTRASPNKTDETNNEIWMTTYDRFEKYDGYQYKGYVKTGDEVITKTFVYIWDVDTNESRLMDVQIKDQSSAYYLFPSSWVLLHDKEFFLVIWANRWQNETTMTLCDYETAICSVIYEHKYEPRQWAVHEDYANIVYSNSSIFVLLPRKQGDNSWQHITRIEITADFKLASLSQVPSGNYDIRNILAYRPNDDLIVYEAQAPHPWNMHLYAAPAGERSVQQQDECLTCGNERCTYQTKAAVALAGKLAVHYWCDGPAAPQQKLFIAGEEEQSLTFTTIPFNISKWKTHTFMLSSGFEAIARVYEGDTNLDAVPVTLIVYGGPESNQVLDKFEGNIYPVGYKYAMVKIDVRGSGGRGWKYRSEIYGRLVTVEVEDTLEAMEMVLAKYPKLDRDRVGVYGWSYGGTLTTALVEKAPQYFFKCAIAVAPVTNFYYYHAMYAESYMGDAPFSAYTDLNEDVTAFLDTKLLLVHGLSDDTVLFRNSALLIEQLQKNDIPFELMVYPNEDHDIAGDISAHLKHQFERFLATCYE